MALPTAVIPRHGKASSFQCKYLTHLQTTPLLTPTYGSLLNAPPRIVYYCPGFTRDAREETLNNVRSCTPSHSSPTFLAIRKAGTD